MNSLTIVGLILLIITLTVNFTFLRTNRTYKKEHDVKRSPFIPYIIFTGLLNFVGLGLMIYGVFN